MPAYPRATAVLLPVIVGLGIWLIPTPEGVETRAWQLLAIFVATIVGLVSRPLPMGAVAIVGITVVSLSNTLTITEALSGFGNRIIWLIAAAFFISRGFIKTGLGNRIAYLFMASVGKTSLGLAYSLAATDLLLAPIIPSNTARGGGVIYPITRSIAETYGSRPDDGTARRLGAFLTVTCCQATVITSAMFFTGSAPNPLAASLAGDLGVDITWGSWAVAAIVPGLTSLAVVPWVISKIYPPEIKNTPEAAERARAELRRMGPLKSGERTMLGIFLLVLLLWVFGPVLGIHSTTAAFVGLSILLVSGTLTWDDILEEKGAWNTLIWVAALVMMAAKLNELGLIGWFSESVSGVFEGVGWGPAFLALSLIYFYTHYFFASMTAHVSAMYSAFLALSIALGAPPMLAALVLAFFSNLFGGLTHYATGPTAVLFGAGYVEMAVWWKLGVLVSVVNIVIWLCVGGAWWRFLGIW